MVTLSIVAGDCSIDGQKRVWRFDRRRKECGFPQLISQTDFHDTSGGFLRRHKCIFGVEIAVCRFGRGEVVPPITSVTSSYTWMIDRFSTSFAGAFRYYSEVFSLAYYKWKLLMYPNGEIEEDGKYLSLFLCMEQSEPQECVYVDFKLSILDQKNKRDRSITGHHRFSAAASNWGRGWSKFLSPKELNDESKGFLVADSIRIEAQITSISALNIISET